MTGLQAAPKAWRSYVMWSSAACFYFYEWLLNVSPSVMRPELASAFRVEATQLGILAGIFFWAYTLLQIPGGVLLDRLGPRRLLTWAAFFCALGSLLFAHADVLMVALLGRLLMGVGASFAAIGCMKVAADWFPLKRFCFFNRLNGHHRYDGWHYWRRTFSQVRRSVFTGVAACCICRS